MAFAEDYRDPCWVRYHRKLSETSSSKRKELGRLLEFTYIHHTLCLDGKVFSHDEMVNAMENGPADRDQRCIMAEVEAFRQVREWVAKKIPLNLHRIHHIHRILMCDGESRYRRMAIFPRMYYHSIQPPDKIPYLMRQLVNFINSRRNTGRHPVSIAAETHQRFMAIYPFEREVGRVGRLVASQVLMSHGCPPLVVTGSDRQAYFQALCRKPELLVDLFQDSVSKISRAFLEWIEPNVAREAKEREARQVV